MKYKKYDDINFGPIFEEYKNTNKSFRELEEKYNIPRTTIRTKYANFINLKNKKQNGGNIKETNIFKSKHNSQESMQNINYIQQEKLNVDPKKPFAIFDKHAPKEQTQKKMKPVNLEKELSKMNKNYTNYD
jgi:hypothetical protein